MTENSLFPSPPEELEQLRQEITEIKTHLKEIANRLALIQRRVDRVFLPPKPVRLRPDRVPTKKANVSTQLPTISPARALEIFEEMTAIWRANGGQLVEERLRRIEIPDLRLVAHEVGITFDRKPSRKLLQSKIIGRINESIMLSTNRNVTVPRSAETTAVGGDEKKAE